MKSGIISRIDEETGAVYIRSQEGEYYQASSYLYNVEEGTPVKFKVVRDEENQLYAINVRKA